MTDISLDEIKIRLAYAAVDRPLPGRLSPLEVIAFCETDHNSIVLDMIDTPFLATMANTMFIYAHRLVHASKLTPVTRKDKTRAES